MKFALVCLFAISTIVCVYGRPQDHYTDKFDNIDVDQILNNDRLLKRYVDCLLERSHVKCPSEALELKKVLADAMATDCAKCTDRQKEIARKALDFLIINKTDMWNDLKSKYDPEEKYAKKYEDRALKKEN
ncbi:Chemosensory protein [Camponotus japonicus]|uniref:Chemosensory protein n=1 Tax=Camponotus japonicus TaxID=84547 RepID=A0A0M4TPW3_9HYME|nr:chemosensory protein [Camponotus japonicus]